MKTRGRVGHPPPEDSHCTEHGPSPLVRSHTPAHGRVAGTSRSRRRLFIVYAHSIDTHHPRPDDHRLRASTVPGRMVAARLFTQFPRRTLVGNSVNRPSSKAPGFAEWHHNGG